MVISTEILMGLMLLVVLAAVVMWSSRSTWPRERRRTASGLALIIIIVLVPVTLAAAVSIIQEHPLLGFVVLALILPQALIIRRLWQMVKSSGS